MAVFDRVSGGGRFRHIERWRNRVFDGYYAHVYFRGCLLKRSWGVSYRDLRYDLTKVMTMVLWTRNRRYSSMQTMKASEFKAKCLKLMDEIQESGEEIVITKNGKPVSKLVPYRIKAATLFGLHRGRIDSGGSDILSTGEAWEAESLFCWIPMPWSGWTRPVRAWAGLHGR